jgi:NADH:ubiquinone oxidoreductase subunit E
LAKTVFQSLRRIEEMKKLIAIFAVLLFAVPAIAADWEFYGSQRVATFYRAFSLEPKGKHTIQVCLGTACHVRGGARVLDYLEKRLEVKSGGTTKDLTFTLESVNCLGACALGPMMVIDKKYYGKINTNKIEPILKKYQSLLET